MLTAADPSSLNSLSTTSETLPLTSFAHPMTSTMRLSPKRLASPLICRVPGSKSYTIRALLLAALTPGAVRILNPLFSDDTLAMRGCLEALGISITQEDTSSKGNIETQNVWVVSGSVADVIQQPYRLNANLSAATLRFLIALSTILPGEQTLLGEHGLNQRPVADLLDSLRAHGAEIDYLDRPGYPPLCVRSSTLSTDADEHGFGHIAVSGKTSSQYVSALMMISPVLACLNQQDVWVDLLDEPISKPYLEMTRDIMSAFGVTVDSLSLDGRLAYRVSKQAAYAIENEQNTYAIETDASSMAYFLAIAALSQSTITVENVNRYSEQADMAVIDILESMGNKITWHPNGRLSIEGKGVKALDLDMAHCPDQAQTIAVLAAFAEGKTHIKGLQSLRVKETDRIAATAAELRKMGITVEEEPDAMTIHGAQPIAATISTYGDHRMAMAFAVAGSVIDGLIIEDPAVSAKTYPGFWDDIQRVGIAVTPDIGTGR